MSPTLTDAILGPALRHDPAQPLLTFYDDATGERTELSAVTLANWAAKTANMIRDEFGLSPSDAVAVDLPTHWQSAAILLGTWWVGGDVKPGPSDSSAALAFCSADRIDAQQADEILVADLTPFAQGISDLPAGIGDYATTVRAHGDRFSGPQAGDQPLPGHTTAQILDLAARETKAQNISAGDRVLSDRDWEQGENLVSTFVAIPLAGASLVQVAHGNPATLNDRASSEKATKILH